MSSSSSKSSTSRLNHVINKAGRALTGAPSGPQAQAPPPNAGIVHGQVLNCYKAVHDYINKMISQVQGMKALLLDTETVRTQMLAEGGNFERRTRLGSACHLALSAL